MIENWDCLSVGAQTTLGVLGLLVLVVYCVVCVIPIWIEQRRCPIWTWPAMPILLTVALGILYAIGDAFYQLCSFIIG